MEKDIVAEHMRVCGYNDRGEEIPDPRPVELPVGFRPPKSLHDTMRDLLRNEEFRRSLEAKDMESFEEADDFEPDDPDPMARSTPYEKNFDPDHVFTREQEIRSGFVEEIPLEKKIKARETIDKYKKNVDNKKSKKSEKEEPDDDKND